MVDVDVDARAALPFPREVVAAYAGDPSNAPEWYANIDSVRWQTPPPLAVGSRMDFEARFLGRRLAYTYEVVELVGLRNRGTRSGFSKVAAPVMRRAMRAAMTKTWLASPSDSNSSGGPRDRRLVQL